MHCARSCIRSAYLLSTAPITLSTRLPAICPCPGPCSYPPRARVWALGIHAGEGSKIPPLCLEDSVQLDIYPRRYVDSESEGECEMSCVFWRQTILKGENGEEGRLQALQDTRWTPIARARPYNPVNGKCNLCLTEKWFIMFRPEGASLNQRSEIFSHCFHKDPQLLKNFKSVIKWMHHCESWKSWASEW